MVDVPGFLNICVADYFVIFNSNERIELRFVSQFDEEGDEYLGTFLVWPIDDFELALEREQWQIFVRWNDKFEAGTVSTDSHPAHPGVNTRWEEINSLLKDRRESMPSNARLAKVRVVHIECDRRYTLSGPAYQLSWRLL